MKLKLANSHEIRNSLNSLVIGEFRYLSILTIYMISTVFQSDDKSILVKDVDAATERARVPPAVPAATYDAFCIY